MDNLLRETLLSIEGSGKRIDDIIFIGSEKSGHSCSWEQFAELADQEYDGDIGIQRVASDLIIVFSDGHKMWRTEEYGAEWWEHSIPFKHPGNHIEIKSLFVKVDGLNTLSDIN